MAECLASVLPQASEVVVVDNGSSGGEAADIARRAGGIVIRSPRNLGFAGGVNLGLGHARGELVGLLNDDAVAGPGWLDTAEAVLADPTVAAVTPKVVLDGVFAEVVLEDDPWYHPGDHRPLGRLLHSVTLGNDEVLERLVGAGVHSLEQGNIDGQPGRWRWTSGRAPFYVPLADPTLSIDVRVNGEPVAVRTRCTLVNQAGTFLEHHGIGGDYGFATPDDGRFDESAERFGFSGTAPVFRHETLGQTGRAGGPVLRLQRGHRLVPAGPAGRAPHRVRPAVQRATPPLGHEWRAGLILCPLPGPAQRTALPRPQRSRRRGPTPCATQDSRRARGRCPACRGPEAALGRGLPAANEAAVGC